MAKDRKISVLVKSATSLAGGQGGGASMPYVLICVDGNKSDVIAKTKPAKASRNPVWNETFKLTKEQLFVNAAPPSVLSFFIIDDSIAPGTSIGELSVPFEKIMKKETPVDGAHPLTQGPGQLNITVATRSDIASMISGNYGTIALGAAGLIATAGLAALAVHEVNDYRNDKKNEELRANKPGLAEGTHIGAPGNTHTGGATGGHGGSGNTGTYGATGTGSHGGGYTGELRGEQRTEQGAGYGPHTGPHGGGSNAGTEYGGNTGTGYAGGEQSTGYGGTGYGQGEGGYGTHAGNYGDGLDGRTSEGAVYGGAYGGNTVMHRPTGVAYGTDAGGYGGGAGGERTGHHAGGGSRFDADEDYNGSERVGIHSGHGNGNYSVGGATGRYGVESTGYGDGDGAYRGNDPEENYGGGDGSGYGAPAYSGGERTGAYGVESGVYRASSGVGNQHTGTSGGEAVGYNNESHAGKRGGVDGNYDGNYGNLPLNRPRGDHSWWDNDSNDSIDEGEENRQLKSRWVGDRYGSGHDDERGQFSTSSYETAASRQDDVDGGYNRQGYQGQSYEDNRNDY
jgi:C2 domain